MKKTPNKFMLAFKKFGNEGDPAFDEAFFDGLLDDPMDEPSDEPQPSVDPELATEEVDPKTEETPAEETPSTEVKTDPVTEAQPKQEEVTTPVQEQPQPEVTPPANEPQSFDFNQVKEELAKNYALTDEQADMLTTDPQKIFPQFAAQLHLQVMAHVLRVFEAALPQQLQAINTRQQTYQQVEGQFKQLYPSLDLAKPDVLNAVSTAASMVKQQFPQLSMDEKVKRVGLLAHSLLGTIPSEVSPAAPVQQAAPKPTPVSPAPARAATKPSSAPTSEWDQLLSELKDED